MNDEQLKAIRERHECFNADWHALDDLRSGSQIAYETEQRLSDASERFPADIAALLEHVAAQAERLRKLEAALREIVEFDPVKMSGVTLYPLAFDLAQAIAERALSDWTPFDDIVADVDEDTAHGG